MSALNIICRADVKVEDHSLPCIAVDAGLFYCQKHQLKIITALGDFDSLDPDVLSGYTGDLQRVPAEKDQSDLELALDYLRGAEEEIYVYGALGGRMDHCLVNLKLCFYTDLNLWLIDEQNRIRCLRPGIHQFPREEGYVSFLGWEACRISLTGFKYPLRNYWLKPESNLTLSNEITADLATVETDNRILIFFTRDRQTGRAKNENPTL